MTSSRRLCSMSRSMSGGSARSREMKRSNSRSMRTGSDGGDAEAVAHRGIGRGAAPLTEDLVLPAELDEVPHGEEIALVGELADDLKLAFELCPDVFRDAAAVALPGPLEGELPEPLPGVLPARKLLGRVAVVDLVQGEPAAGRHLQGAGDGVRIVLEKGRERGRGLQVVLRVGLDQTPGGGEPDPVADAGEHVLELSPRGVMIEHLGARHRGDAVAPRPLPQAPFLPRLFRAAVAGHQRVEPVAEGVPEVPGDERGVRLPHQQAVLSAPQRHEPAGMGADLAPFHDALSLG